MSGIGVTDYVFLFDEIVTDALKDQWCSSWLNLEEIEYLGQRIFCSRLGANIATWDHRQLSRIFLEIPSIGLKFQQCSDSFNYSSGSSFWVFARLFSGVELDHQSNYSTSIMNDRIQVLYFTSL
jgi:hypothetical protein